LTLFDFKDSVGRSVRLGEEWCEVVGVLTDRASATSGGGPLAGRDLNQSIIVPLSSSLGSALDPLPGARVNEIWLHAAEGDDVTALAAIVSQTLTRLHHGSNDFEVIVPLELLRERYRVQQTFDVVVGSVALLSLVVGGIGIMNVMLASVLERTSEIGLRRSVGATRGDVRRQFLAEALMVTCGGGSAGICAGAVASWTIAAYAKWPTHTSATAIVAALLVSTLVGLAFGIYPATRAARLQPIDAVRYE
jgi:putative ABC transport system permease protein